MSSLVNHFDPISYAFGIIDKADKSPTKYDDRKLALEYMIAELILKLEGLGNEVGQIAQESNAFSEVLMDLNKVKASQARIKQWIADHPNTSMYDAMKDPGFKAEVDKFSAALEKYHNDAAKYDQAYHMHGMGEATENSNLFWDTKIEVGQNKSIGQLIQDGDKDGLAAALFKAGKTSTDKSGAFHDWDAGKDGKIGSDNVKTDFGVYTANFTNELNKDGTLLQQGDQMGQNVINSVGALINMIVQALRPQI